MSVEQVTVVVDPKCWFDHSSKVMRNYVRLRGKDGGWFYDDYGNPRRWKRSSGVYQFLRRVTKKYPSLAYIVTNEVTGRVVHINTSPSMLNPAAYGSHDWTKANAVTQMEHDGRSYDTWRCRTCHTEIKRYGLSSRPPLGHCEKNPVAKST